MTQIEIPFRGDMARAVREGRKICTTRTTPRGKVGDRFTVGAVECELTGVEAVKLWQVAERFYKAEGFATPEDFEQTWEQIHPLKGWDPDQRVFIHFFKVVDP